MSHYNKYKEFKQLSFLLNSSDLDSELQKISATNSVHLLYYSVVQLIQHLLIKYNELYPDQDSIKDAAKNRNMGYHNLLLTEIKAVLRDENADDPENYKLPLNVNILKGKRAISDYSKRYICDEKELKKLENAFNTIESILLKINS